MITLKEARELAENITDKDTKIPKPSGLRDWISKDLLSSYERIKEGGRGNGRIGLYDDSLPIQILVTAKLNNEYTLKEIAEIAEKIKPELIKRNGNIKELKKLYKEKEQLEYTTALKNETNARRFESLDIYDQDLKKEQNKRKKLMMELDYIYLWIVMTQRREQYVTKE